MEKLSETLKEHKLRNTQARKDIYKLLEKSQYSLSPKEVFENVGKQSNTDLVSIYRNLSLFEEIGLAHRFQDGKYSKCEHQHMELLNNKHQHVHFINHCSSCGKSSEVKAHSKEICNLAGQLKKISKLLNTYQEIVIQGHCDECVKNKTQRIV